MMKNNKFYSLILMCLFTACTPTPVYESFPVIPPDSRSCVADVEQYKIDCQARKLPLVEQCRITNEMLHQQKMGMYQSEKNRLNAELQVCLNNCLSDTYTNPGTGEIVPYNLKACKYGVNFYNEYGILFHSTNGPCKNIVDKIETMSTPNNPNMRKCEHITKSCDDEYELNFKRCGGYYERRCVSNCEKAK